MSCARVNRWLNCPEWRSPFTTDELLFHFGKGLVVPREGWTRATFAQDGRRLMLALHRTAQLTQRKAIPFVARKAKSFLDGQVDALISRVKNRRGVKSSIAAIDEATWLHALEEVISESHLELALEIVPPIQSVLSQGYSKTATMLGDKPEPGSNAEIAQQARGIAQKITRINDTTRREIENTIRDSIEHGAGVVETAEKLRERMDGLNHNRSITIARTELNNAFTQGSARAYKESETLTHVSVIGCEERETNNQWQYNGQSTCGYLMLPKHELDAFLEVGFHPNHGGTICAAAFV